MSKALILTLALLAISPLTIGATDDSQQCQTSLCPTGQAGQTSTCPVNQASGQYAGCMDPSQMISDMAAVVCGVPATMISWLGQMLPGTPTGGDR